MSNSTTDDIVMEPYNIYGYTPNETAAYVVAAIFGVLFLVTGVLTIRFRSWFFLVVPIASLMEVIGMAMRPGSEYTLSKYIVSVLMVLLAPTIYAMADYAMLSKL